jgi:hypothetical protein
MIKLFSASVLIILCFFVASCYNTTHVRGQESRNDQKNDSVYIIIDSLTVNKTENTFDKVLVYKIDNQYFEIYRKTITDYASEFNYGYTYSDTTNSYMIFSIENLPVGNVMDIIFNIKDKVFYKSSWYNAILLNGSIDFKTGKAKGLCIESPNCGDVEDIKLTKTWEATEEYKNKTTIK